MPTRCVKLGTRDHMSMFRLDHGRRLWYHSRMTIGSAFKLATGVAVALLASLVGSGQNAVELKVGDEAPAFSLTGSDAKTYRLADFKGKSAVVLAWFPKAFTGG